MIIDTQSHILPPWFLAELGSRSVSPRAFSQDGPSFVQIEKWTRRVNPKATSLTAKIEDMDRAGVDITLLSPEQPGPELFGAEGVALASRLNDYIAECCAAYPTRLCGLAVLPLQDVPASIAELRRATEQLGQRGALLFANVAGQTLDEPQFAPLFEYAAAEGVPLYLHPAYPLVGDETADYDMIPGVGFMIDTALAALRLILSGTLERLPNLQLVLPHAGGALPYLIGRVDDQVTRLKRGGERISKLPSEYLRQMYTDTVSPSPMNIEFALRFWGADKVLFGTDHPFTQLEPYIDLVNGAGLSESDRDLVFGGNAQRLFGIGRA